MGDNEMLLTEAEKMARKALQQECSAPNCDCIKRMNGTGYWYSECYCDNKDDNATAAGWCDSENQVPRITKLVADLLTRPTAATVSVEGLVETLQKVEGWLVCAVITSPEDFQRGAEGMLSLVHAALSPHTEGK